MANSPNSDSRRMALGADPQWHPGVLEQLLRLGVEEMEMILVEHDPDRSVRRGSKIGVSAGDQQVVPELEMNVGEVSSRLDSVDASFHPSGLRFQRQPDVPVAHPRD